MITSRTHDTLDFSQLVTAIRQVHQELFSQANRAVNISLTLRNWLIGRYISMNELSGADRATYGDKVLSELAERLSDVSNCNKRQLYRYLSFYRCYPEIVGTPSPLSHGRSESLGISGIVGTLSTLSDTPNEKIFHRLSYSHIEQLVELEDDTKRSFYEEECLRGNWSVRELKRQINSLYYERSDLSSDKKALAHIAQQQVTVHDPRKTIRDPYVFEFLGLKPREVMSESHLEDELAGRLEEFLLELGHGFCFEARQKRILIGEEHFFIDLVFYHRILKCHILVELKLEPFSHENIGQLNTYVSWYRKNMMMEGDNPPIGILLCTAKNQALAEYALAGMDNNLFVSKYQLELPRKEEMQAFIEQQVREHGVVSKDPTE